MSRRSQPSELEIRERRVDVGWKVELVDPMQTETPRSWCTVVDVNLRIGHSTLATGGIGGVGTRQEDRRKGYSRRVMEAAVDLMGRERYALSFLHGIQDYYHKFGYITCTAEHEFALEADSLPGGRPKGTLRLRPVTSDDLPRIARRYNRDNACRTGSCVRDPKRFDGFPKGTWWTYRADARVVVDAADRILGCVVCDRVKEHCRVSEILGDRQDVYAAVIAYLKGRARRGGHRHVWINAPTDHPFAIHCRQFGLRLHSLYPRNEKPMGRIIDLPNTMEGILPELEHRWGRQDRDLILPLQTDLGTIAIGWRRKRLCLLPIPAGGRLRLGQRELTLLLFGYARPSDLLIWQQATIPVPLRPLVERLFPLQEAHMWWTDRF